MMRLLYVSRSDGVHDRRFVSAWRAIGADVDQVVIPERETADAGGLAARIAAHQPDLIQVGPITWPAPLVAASWTGPLIATSWGFDLLLEAGESDELRRAATEVLRRADLVFVDNIAVEAAAHGLGADPGASKRFPWGLDRDWLAQPPAARTDTAQFVFTTTRRHEPMYHVADVLRAFLNVAAARPAAVLKIAGSGSLTGELRAIAAGSPAGERVEFLGELDARQLRALHAATDVYVSSSIVDGTSISLLEAMASGALPLVSDIVGNVEWVTADVGYRYPVGDLARLAHAMRQCMELTNAERDTMARRGFDLVRERADWRSTIDRLPEYAALAVERHRKRGTS